MVLNSCEGEHPLVTTPDEKTYYAHRSEGEFYWISLSREWVELHELSHPIVAVRVRERRPEDPPPCLHRRGWLVDYWGWLKTGADHYTFIFPSKDQMQMCFPYGPDSDERLGRGRQVRLIVEEVTGPDLECRDEPSRQRPSA